MKDELIGSFAQSALKLARAGLVLILSIGTFQRSCAQPCQEVCFLIQNEFSQETLRRFMAAYPDNPYVAMAKDRIEYLNSLKAKMIDGSNSAFPPPRIVKSERYHQDGGQQSH